MAMKAHKHNHPHKQQELSTLKNRLRGQAQKITGPRAAILEYLARASASAHEQ